MRAVLLLVMAEHFNDWDLQAVVRSCGSVAHPDPPGRPRGAASAPREEAEEEAPAPAEPATLPAAARGEAPPARAAPVAPPAQGHERAAPAKGAALLYDLEYLDLDRKPFLLLVTPPPLGDDAREREVMISFPAAAAASTSGAQQGAVPPGRKAGARTPGPKRSKKSQLKKVVREMPVADSGASSSDPWAWRKYGQKPIKGSPYPRGYYKCSSMKGCMARKLVERSPAKPGVLIVTYMAEHCHPVPTQLNALAGTTRHKSSSSGAAASSSPKSHDHEQQRPPPAGTDAEDAARCDADSNGKSALEFGVEEMGPVDGENELWPAGMDLDELLAPVDDDFDFDFEHAIDDGDGVLGRRLSL
ncbi:putative WRKY transcription factor 65 [Panicum miliaceum]|uniref:WRKY transcription factor 65 n=1 Tax=Panicum miliaceum TaxID=4540 RepID=A0A3L6SNJ8_PANMI|nr:putative WRKY transcription factor 65 [Panicum miliaceum]